MADEERRVEAITALQALLGGKFSPFDSLDDLNALLNMLSWDYGTN